MTSFKKIAAALATILVLLGSASGLMAQNQTLGLPEMPHGYPAYFQDSDGLKLELCLDNATMCFFDAVNATGISSDFAQLIGWDGEAFWFLAEAAETLPGPTGDQAILVLGVEATYGGNEAVVDGGQITFGRLRIRIDTRDSGTGTYRILHPYGEEILVAATADKDGINFTRDVGAVDVLNPAAAYNATLLSDVMNPGRALPLNATSFLTWPDYESNASLQDQFTYANGTTVTRQYIGMPVPHVVVGSPYGADRNRFIVQKDNGAGGWNTLINTDLFTVHGRVFVDRTINVKTTFGDQPPVQMLAGHGPINRETPFLEGSNATITGALVPGYPLGYPLWYEDMSGLKLTITFPPMGISSEVNASVPEQVALGTGGETFFWSAMALQRDYQPGFDASVEFAMEGTFGGDESLVDGNQIAFGRTRIRIGTPAAGTYTVQHPYGNNTFEVTDAALGINYTADVGGADPFNPDAAFTGALFGTIGPNFLTWDTFNPIMALNDPLLVKDVNGTRFSYVGDPGIPHAVKGGTYRQDVLITGPNGINFTITDFTVTGQVFNEQGFGFLPSIYLLLD